MEDRSLEAVVNTWIQVEEYTEREFGRLTTKAETSLAKNTFQYLSDAGRRHAETLRYVLTLASDDEKVASIRVFTPLTIPDLGSRNYRSSVEELYYGAREHMSLEEEMGKAYGYLSKVVKSVGAVKLLHSLSEEEKAHHNQLQALIRVFEDTYPFLKKP